MKQYEDGTMLSAGKMLVLMLWWELLGSYQK